MARTRFSLQSLKDVDMGRGDIAFSNELAAAVADINDRPGVKTARKVLIEVTLKPELRQSQSGHSVLEGIETTFEFATELPRRRSSPIKMTPGHDGGLYFNSLSPDNPRQGTLDEVNAPPQDGDQADNIDNSKPTTNQDGEQDQSLAPLRKIG